MVTTENTKATRQSIALSIERLLDQAREELPHSEYAHLLDDLELVVVSQLEDLEDVA